MCLPYVWTSSRDTLTDVGVHAHLFCMLVQVESAEMRLNVAMVFLTLTGTKAGQPLMAKVRVLTLADVMIDSRD